MGGDTPRNHTTCLILSFCLTDQCCWWSSAECELSACAVLWCRTLQAAHLLPAGNVPYFIVIYLSLYLFWTLFSGTMLTSGLATFLKWLNRCYPYKSEWIQNKLFASMQLTVGIIVVSINLKCYFIPLVAVWQHFNANKWVIFALCRKSFQPSIWQSTSFSLSVSQTLSWSTRSKSAPTTPWKPETWGAWTQKVCGFINPAHHTGRPHSEITLIRTTALRYFIPYLVWDFCEYCSLL